MSVLQDIVVAIRSDGDIVSARQQGRSLAAAIGFSATDATLIATAISELARNIVMYADTARRDVA
jgi:serine/threonine-protein kinase RsbT